MLKSVGWCDSGGELVLFKIFEGRCLDIACSRSLTDVLVAVSVSSCGVVRAFGLDPLIGSAGVPLLVPFVVRADLAGVVEWHEDDVGLRTMLRL